MNATKGVTVRKMSLPKYTPPMSLDNKALELIKNLQILSHPNLIKTLIDFIKRVLIPIVTYQLGVTVKY